MNRIAVSAAYTVLAAMCVLACSSSGSEKEKPQPICTMGVLVCSDDNSEVRTCSAENEIIVVETCDCDSCYDGVCMNEEDFCDYRITSCDTDTSGSTAVLNPHRDSPCCPAEKRDDCLKGTICNPGFGCVVTSAPCSRGTVACNSAGDKLLICRGGEWEEMGDCPCGCENGACRSGDMGRCAYTFDSCLDIRTESRRLLSGSPDCCPATVERRCAEGVGCWDKDGGCKDLLAVPDGDDDEEADISEEPLPDGDVDEDREIPLTKSGSVTIGETRSYLNDRSVMSMAYASAHFAQIQTTPGGTTYGDCIVYPWDPDQEIQTNPGLNAGQVTVTGAKIDPIILTPREVESYGWLYDDDMGDGVQDLFDDGESIGVSAYGGVGVGGFNGSFSAVAEIGGLTPDLFDGALELSTASPPSFTWTPGGDEMIFTASAYLFENMAIVEGATITCITADDGEFAFPSVALDELPDGAQSFTVSVIRRGFSDLRVGDAQVFMGSIITLTRTWSE